MTTTGKLNRAFFVKDEAELRSTFAATHDIAVKKYLDHIDQHTRAFIERSESPRVAQQICHTEPGPYGKK
jgi:hypothetical protein